MAFVSTKERCVVRFIIGAIPVYTHIKMPRFHNKTIVLGPFNRETAAQILTSVPCIRSFLQDRNKKYFLMQLINISGQYQGKIEPHKLFTAYPVF